MQIQDGMIVLCPTCCGRGDVFLPETFTKDSNEPIGFEKNKCLECDGMGRMVVKLKKMQLTGIIKE